MSGTQRPPKSTQFLETLCMSVDQQLWSVYIDMNCGFKPADWGANSEPKTLSEALRESACARGAGWKTKLEPVPPQPD